MYDDGDRAELRARIDAEKAKSKGLIRWSMVVLHSLLGAFMFGSLFLESLVFTNRELGTTLDRIIPVVGWLLFLTLQVMAAALGSGDAFDEEDEIHAQNIRRVRKGLFISAVCVWLLTIVLSFLLWNQFARDAYWGYLFFWGLWGVGGFALMVLTDSKQIDSNLRQQAMRKLLNNQMLEQLEMDLADKPKRKNEVQPAVLGDDGELILPDSSERRAATHKQ